jgi:hypothetical protein
MNIQKIDDLESVLKNAGYNNLKRASANRVIVFTEENRQTVLGSVADIVGGRYTTARTGTGWKSSTGGVLVGNFVIIAKPLTKGSSSNISTLDARAFSKKGKLTKFNYLDTDVEVATFTSADQIKDSILQGCKTNSMLGEAYYEMFLSFFNGGKIEWNPEVQSAVINKLGVYIGELMIGWVFLSKTQSKHFTSNPFKGNPKAFHIPTDPAFSGVDSFIEMSDGTYYGISSKFGAGAKASIFTNLLKNGIEKESKLSPSVFKDLCKTAKTNNLKYKNSRSIVYAYGVRNILKIPSSKLANPDVVYDQAYKNTKDKEVAMVVAAIMTHTMATPDIKKNLPFSISSFFNRTIADMLNRNQASLDQIEEILTGKDYWQANLDINKWKNGEVEFKFVRSSKAKIKLFGNKSSIPDITAKQGWINYELS